MSTEAEFRPGLADVPAAESAVSFIDGKKARLEYRGIAVEVLARESCFEETAWLLSRATCRPRSSSPTSTTSCAQRRRSSTGSRT